MTRPGFFFLLCFASCVLPASAPAQPKWFLISEPELQSIEQAKSDWESSRLDWQKQAIELKTKAQGLSTQLSSLNALLSSERAVTVTLRQSFNRFERERSVQLSLLSSANKKLELDLAASEGNLAWWRLLAICGLGVMIGGTMLLVRQMFRRKI